MQTNTPIAALFSQQRPLRSIEFFPPKDDAGVEALRDTAAALRKISWDYVSVTYGAGGSTQDGTLAAVQAILGEGQQGASHFTCVGATRESGRERLAQRVRLQ